jgi:hypothetical protein
MTTSIDELDDIRGLFVSAAVPGPLSIPRAIHGLRTLLFAVIEPKAIPASNEAVVRLANAIYAAGMAVAEQVEPHMRADAVNLGMGAASHLAMLLVRDPQLSNATEAKKALIGAWADHTALLAFELDALLRRRSIKAQGDVFRRSIVIDRAMAASADGVALH